MPKPKSFGIGLVGEKTTAHIFNQFGYKATIDNQPTYDITCHEKRKFKIEVKYDVMAERTGNIAVEYFNSNKDEPSGVANTTSDMWVFVINDSGNKTVWAISVKKFKEFLSNPDNKHRVFHNAGDGNADLLLYHESVILPHFTRLDGISNEKEFDKTIRKIMND